MVMPASVQATGQRKGKGKGNGDGPGRPVFKAGDKIWPGALLHKGQDFLKAYPGKPTMGEGGASSAGWDALKQCQQWAAPDMLGEALSYQNTELINRPSIGFSEYCSCLENFHLVVCEGAKNKIFHQEFSTKVETLYTKYDILTACQTLNTVNYPAASRSAAEMTKATGLEKRIVATKNKKRKNTTKHDPNISGSDQPSEVHAGYQSRVGHVRGSLR